MRLLFLGRPARLGGAWTCWLVEDAVGTGTISTGRKCGPLASDRVQSSLRQRKSWLACMPAQRAIAETVTPGSKEAATSCSFSPRVQRRRRSAAVMTSPRTIVIGLLLGLPLGRPLF